MNHLFFPGLLALGLLAVGVLPGATLAATLPVTPGAGANILTKQDSAGSHAPSHTLCDPTNPQTCAPVTAAGLLVDLSQGNGNNALSGLAASSLNLHALSFLYGWNGTSWDQVVNGHGPATGALRVELPTDGTGKVGLNAGSAVVGKVGIDQTIPGTTNAVTVTNYVAPPLASSYVSGAITTPMTVTTSTLLIAAPSAGLRNYISSCVVGNENAVGTRMSLQDGSGGAVIWVFEAAASNGGTSISFGTVALRQPTLATGLFIVNGTTGASTVASCNGYTGA